MSPEEKKHRPEATQECKEWGFLGHLWVSWGALRTSSGPIEPAWDHLGSILVSFGSHLGPTWAPEGAKTSRRITPHAAPCVLVSFWSLFTNIDLAFWVYVGMHFGMILHGFSVSFSIGFPW